MDTLTLIVAVDDYSLNQAKKRNFYACPASYGRDRGDYIAFYQKSPVSAITHFAKIEDIVSNEEEDILTSKDKLMMIPARASDDATIFKLGEVQEFEKHVENDIHGGVQGAWFKDFQDVKTAEVLSELKRED